MNFMLQYGELPQYLRIAYVFSLLFIICHIIVMGTLIYWQMFEPDNLSYKTWFKGPMHLDSFENVTTASIVFAVFLLLQLVGLFMYTSWMFDQGKKIYYLTFALVILGIWTYFLLPAVILLAFMLPEVSLHHFGILSFEDLF